MEMEIRDEIEYSYQQWISEKEGWTRQYASRVLREYGRFLYLCTKQQVTPSKDVDACWHGHLLHSRHYIDELPKIVGRVIHHTPGRAGPDAKYDRQHWQRQYTQTLDLYQSVFGEAPPEDIWPRPVTSKNKRHRERKADMKMIFYAAILAVTLIVMNANDIDTVAQAAVTVVFLMFMLMTYIFKKEMSRPSPYARETATGRGKGKGYGQTSNDISYGGGSDNTAGSLHYLHKDNTHGGNASDHTSWGGDDGGGGSSCGGGCGGGGD